MLNEFKAFIARGNVMDLAVGVIIGAAFSKIVESVVNDLVMPLVGALTGGGFDFSNYFLALSSNVTASSLAAGRCRAADGNPRPAEKPPGCIVAAAATATLRFHHRNRWKRQIIARDRGPECR